MSSSFKDFTVHFLVCLTNPSSLCLVCAGFDSLFVISPLILPSRLLRLSNLLYLAVSFVICVCLCVGWCV